MKKILTTITLIIATIVLAGSVLAATGTINTSNLNFRSKASTDSDVIQKLSKGDKVDIISEEGDWYKISYNSKEGYVKKDYIDKDTETVTEETTPSETETTSDVAESPNTTAIKEVASLYILPLLNSTNLGVLQVGQKVNLISVNGNWAYIQTANQSGWVFASKLEKTEITITSSSTNTTAPTITNTTVTNTIETVPENTVKAENNVAPAEETTNTKTEETPKQEETSEYPITMYVNVDDINVRAKPNTSSTVITTLEKKTSVKVIGKEDNWYKVETSEGTGYIRQDLLKQ